MSESYEVRFWKIEEAVGAGNFITLPGIFTTEEGAKKAIRTGRHVSRAVEYQRGRGTTGPERVNP